MAAIIRHCHLPLELINEILVRLPVKSLLRFRSVCKQWCDITSRVSFMQNHLHHESNQVRLLVHWCRRYYFNIQGFLLFMDETLERYETDQVQLPGQIDLIVGPCNGVFCVTNFCDKLALWNPSTRKMRPLPAPQPLPLPAPQPFKIDDGIGFGVDPLTDEFKIILIHTSLQFSIYTSSNDSWRYYKNEPLLTDSLLSILEYPATFSKGFAYWRKYNERTSTSVILAFDMRNEVFQEIELPNDVRNELLQESMPHGDDDIERRAVLDVFEDSLAMFCYDYYRNKNEGNNVDVWVMQEQGHWIKTFTLGLLPFNFYKSFGFWTRKNIIFSKRDKAGAEELVLYGPDSGSTRIVTVQFREDGGGIKLWVFNYKESLFPVKGRNDIQDYGTQSAVSREFFFPTLDC